MEKIYYEEMIANLEGMIQKGILQNKKVYLFGHCNASETLIDVLLDKGFAIEAVLDNNKAKHGKAYRGITIVSPEKIVETEMLQTIVLIVARAYAAMELQLLEMDYCGDIQRLVDYNSYAEYSLSEETIRRKMYRIEQGRVVLDGLKQKYPSDFMVFCPFSALGDVYFTMSYLPFFLQKRKIRNCVVGVIGNACAQVVKLFGDYKVEMFSQKDMDETIQAALYYKENNFFVSHQDRPYVINLSKALYIKKISLEQIYCCGVFGLPAFTKPYKPIITREYSELYRIIPNKSVILAPYAKSITVLSLDVWERIVDLCSEKGYKCFTNVIGDEKALPGTYPISPTILEMQSVVERAGIFIGLRSGLCDVIREASCRKIALYPDYNYSDTQWTAIEMYELDGWENIVVK